MTKLPIFPPKLRVSFLLIIILSIVFFSFLPVLENEFVFWDDDVHLYENIMVRSLDAEHVGNIFKGTVNKLYIPLTSLSFAIEYHYFEYDPFIYHLNNLLLHLAILGLIFWLGIRLGLSTVASGFAALLFGIHPMHVESVAWVTERKDVLYTFFYMASLISYCRYLDFTRSTPSIVNKKLYRYLVLSGLFGILSILAKPMALSLPLILLLLDWFHGRKFTREAIVEKIPLVVVFALITWMSYAAHARIPGKGFIEGMLIWSWTFVFYIKQFVFPFILLPVYQLPKPVTLVNHEYILSVIVLCLFILSAVRFRKNQWFIFALLYYFFSIFFLLRFDESKDLNIVADRFMYLPSLGFCFLIGYGLQWAWEYRIHLVKYSSVTLVTVILLLLSIKTYHQSQIWQDSISLWRYQLKYNPREPVALNNLAAALREEEEYKIAEEFYRRALALKADNSAIDLSDEAQVNMKKVEYVMGLYVKAIQSNANFVDSYYNLGQLLAEIGNIPEAVDAYKNALALDHEYKDVHFSLGELYQQVGDYNQAIYAFEQTIALNPKNEDVYVEVITSYNKELEKNPENELYRKARKKSMNIFTNLISSKSPTPRSYYNLGFLYGGMGDFTSAISAYQMVLDINPNHINSIYNLGNIYRDYGRLSDAVSMYERVAQLGSKKSDAYLNMGTIYERQGKKERARESFQMAIQEDSLNSRAYFNLGYVEERAGNHTKAVNLYQKAIELEPNNAKAHYNLGNTYARMNRNSQAITSYLKAVEIDFKYMDAWINLSTISFREGYFDNAVKYCDEAILLGYNPPAGYVSALAPYRVKDSEVEEGSL